METKEKKINIYILIFRIVSLLIIAFCLYLLYNWNIENNANSDIASNLSLSSKSDGTISLNDLRDAELKSSDENQSLISKNNESNNQIKTLQTDFDKLLNSNSDTVAWIRIENANIDYPIVQAQDNNYYLNQNFYKKHNSAGWIFADYRNKFDTLDKNTIIYGHNRRNGTMFSNLKKYLDSNYSSKEENKFFNFNTVNKNYIAEIFSVYKSNSNVLSFSNTFESHDAFDSYLNSYKDKSLYDFKTEVSASNKILTLCTCDNNNLYRIVIHAKLIPIN